MSIVTRGKAWFAAAKEKGKRGLATARRRVPPLDHVIRAYQRYDGESGNQQAGAVTFFGFLSFFPLLALAFAVAGYAVVIYPEAQDQLIKAIKSALPGIAGQLDVQRLADARQGAGIIGLVGLLVAGLGWVAALREALHRVWLKDPAEGGNFVIQKLFAIVVLIILGLCLLASVAVSTLATSATDIVLGFVGLGRSVVASWLVTILAIAIPLLFDTVIFLVMFSRLSGTEQPWRALVRGAVLGAVGFEILKLVGTAYIPTVASDPVYGTFGLMVGLLVWINLIARFTLFAGSWTATARVNQGRVDDGASDTSDVPGSAPAGASAAESAGATRSTAQ